MEDDKTIVYAVYILHHAGSPLFAKLFQAPKDAPPTEILSALLSAFTSIVKDITTGDPKSFITDTVHYHMRRFRGVQVVIATNTTELPLNALNKLGLIFMKNYGEYLLTEWKGDVSRFQAFERVADTVINSYFEFDTTKMINPTKKFSTMYLYYLDNHLKGTAISLVTLKEGTLEQIADLCEEPPRSVYNNLRELQGLGYVGIKRRDDEFIYFYHEQE